jgi:hypothetical protein
MPPHGVNLPGLGARREWRAPFCKALTGGFRASRLNAIFPTAVDDRLAVSARAARRTSSMTNAPQIDARALPGGWESRIIWPNGEIEVLPFKASTRAEALNQAQLHIRALSSLGRP